MMFVLVVIINGLFPFQMIVIFDYGMSKIVTILNKLLNRIKQRKMPRLSVYVQDILCLFHRTIFSLSRFSVQNVERISRRVKSNVIKVTISLPLFSVFSVDWNKNKNIPVMIIR